MSLFAVCFLGASYPIPSTHWTQVDPTHYVLDVCALVEPRYWELKEVALFLAAPGMLQPDLALGLYVKAGSSEWLYRGCVHSAHPSEAMPLQWPAQGAGPAVAPAPGCVQVGVSIEPLAELAAKEGSRLGDRMAFGRRVGLDLYRFLESFARPAAGMPTNQVSGDVIAVPTSALDRWLQRFETRFRLDPEFLTRDAEKL